MFGEVCDYIPLQEDHRQRWAAPECLLEGKYSVKSDVWAFGVFMYEVFTCGGIPYTTDMGLQVAKIKPHVRTVCDTEIVNNAAVWVKNY